MKVVTVVKTGRGGSGISQMTRYISERERDEQREGIEPRKLFSEDAERLNFYQANILLGGGREPRAKDVLHVVISFEKEEEFNQLGSDEEARQQEVRETTRSTMREMTALFKADDLRWVAGIHHNTENPHVHLLICRDYTDRETGQSRRLKTLPRDMRVAWERAEDGKQIVKPGILNETFEKILEQRRERMKRDIREERFLIGRAMIAEDVIERLNKRLADAAKYGEYFRYQFSDGEGRSRGFSEHDVRQRGWAKAIQVMANDQSNWTSERRRQRRDEIIADEFGRHQELIIEHRKKRAKQIGGITAEIEKKDSESRQLFERASQIKGRYEAAGKLLPVPILTRDELGSLQDHAVEIGGTSRILKLEDIRTALAAESGTPTRRDIEIGRLRAQLFVAQSSLTLEQETALRFEETKHLMRWNSTGVVRGKAGHGGAITRSLADIERMLAWEKDQAKFIGARYIHWNDSRRHEASNRVENLSREQERMLNQIEARRAEITEQVERKAELVSTLYKILLKEEQRYRNEGHELPGPLFSANELRELDNHAMRRRDPEFHRALVEIERNLKQNLDPRTDPKEWPTFYGRVGRARARAYLAEIGLRQSELSVERFNERRKYTEAIVKDDGKRNITIARLADIKPASPLEQLLHPQTALDDRYREVTAALEAYHERLIEEHKKASESFGLLVEEARMYEEEFARRNPSDPMPKPRFTPVEISKLELHAAKESDPALKAKYEELYCEALEAGEDEREKIVLEDKAEEILNPVSLDHQERISEKQYESDYLQRPGSAHEVSIER
jgi:relaxase MobL-like protein